MATIFAVILIASIAWWAHRSNERDQKQAPATWTDDAVRQSIVHIRQDLKLVAGLLAGLLLMLAIVADTHK